jgi:hypothetical protein
MQDSAVQTFRESAMKAMDKKGCDLSDHALDPGEAVHNDPS